MNIELCEFAERQLDANYAGTRVTPEIVESLIKQAEVLEDYIPGYADFCRILCLKNTDENGEFIFNDLTLLTVEKEWAINNGGVLKTAYEARNENELPVLVEWIEGIEPPVAPFVHLILYSREQLEKEGEYLTADWGIVSIQTAATEMVEPMRPITAMRNALGIEEGGSGVAIDRQAYLESAEYWGKYSIIRECP